MAGSFLAPSHTVHCAALLPAPEISRDAPKAHQRHANDDTKQAQGSA